MRRWIKPLARRRISTRCFIVGAPRSGTTLLQTRLAAHPQLTGFAETHLYPRADGIGVRPEVQAGRSGADVYKAELVALLEELCDVAGVDAARVLPILRGRRVSRLKASFLTCLDTIAVRAGYVGWIEKTPAHVRYIPAIQRTLPQAVFIHILRDGLPVVASLLDVTARYPKYWGGAPWTLDQCVDVWNRDVETSLAYQGAPGHRLIPYESFIYETDSYTRNLWRFLQVDPANSGAPQQVVAFHAIVRGFEHWKQDAAGPVQRSRNSRVRDVLSPAQIEQATRRLRYGGRVPIDLRGIGRDP